MWCWKLRRSCFAWMNLHPISLHMIVGKVYLYFSLRSVSVSKANILISISVLDYVLFDIKWTTLNSKISSTRILTAAV